jgi:hypothetical protein
MTVTSPGELGRQFEPLAEKLHALTKPLSRDALPAALRLAVLTGETAQLVGYVLRNTGEGRVDSARHNLQILHDLAEKLTVTTRAALADCAVRIPVLHGRCLAKVQLDDAEREWLEFRPYAANEVPPTLSCDLEADHPGPHASNAQQGDRIEWWVHWTLRASEITQQRACGAEKANTNPAAPEETDICLLYAGHAGRHSFDIGA